MRPVLRTPNPICAFVVAGWLLGAVEAFVDLRSPLARGAPVAGLAGPIVVVAFAAALTAAPAVALGLGAWVVGELGARLGPARTLARLVGRWLAPPPTADRAAVVRRHAIVLGALAGLALLTLGATLWLRRLWDLQAADLGLRLGVGGIVVLVLPCALAAALVARALVRPLGALDRRWQLPRPRNALGRYLAFVLLPAWLLLVPLLRRYRALLGAGASLLGLLLLALLAGAVALAWRASGPVPRRRGRLVCGGMLGLGALGLALACAVYPRYPEWERRSETGLGASVGARLVRWATDVDRDGASSLLGGGDCAPFDARRYPAAVEIPGNGVDENCDGSDALPTGAPAQRYSDALRPEQVQRYHVLWIIIDGLRADHVGTLGYRREVTPYIDQLAEQSLLFTQAYAQSSATVFSFASMFFGVNPEAITWYRKGEWPQPTDRVASLAERLRADGYRTAVFLNDWTERVYPGLLEGFEVVAKPRVLPDWKYWSQQSSPMITEQVIQFIEHANPDAGPLFMTVYYNDTHFPYVEHPAVPPFGTRPVDLYDGEIAFTDRFVGFLLSYLRFRPRLWDHTVVVVTADHGEEFGEHASQHHANDCFADSTHVPLVVHVPGLDPLTSDAPVALVDIVPTVLELTGATRDYRELQGQSLLVPVLAPDRSSPDRAIFCAVASQYKQAEHFLRRGVRAGRYSLMQDLGTGEAELFDLGADPHERRNLGAEPRSAATRQGLEQLLAAGRTGNMGTELP